MKHRRTLTHHANFLRLTQKLFDLSNY